MILVKIGIQDGENEYYDWTHYENFNQTDYLEGKITDREMLSEFWGQDFGDDDCFDKGSESYWLYTSCVWVSNVLNISEQDLKTLRQYGILY
tara:strand:- start:53 stop:328 length:276 start_codon:yes stop_codon:yes gene_type:complete